MLVLILTPALVAASIPVALGAIYTCVKIIETLIRIVKALKPMVITDAGMAMPQKRTFTITVSSEVKAASQKVK